MPEPRKDMLPDKEATDTDVVNTPAPAGDKPEQTDNPTGDEGNPDADQGTPPANAPADSPSGDDGEGGDDFGSKTPDRNLAAALKEERTKRKDLEKKVKDLESSSAPSGDDYQEEDDADSLRKQLKDTNARLDAMESQSTLDGLEKQYPALKDKADEFEDYRDDPDNAGMSVKTAAKAFLAENGLLGGKSKARPGLEKPTGGSKVPQGKLSKDDIKELREKQPRKYQRMIQDGTLKPEDIV
ncbi:MAG: hypothetical protein CMB99_15385 [Flavobacteriaceae bacterium]|nr:hypothetical protein [Flavobacteriaceae bacterium]|tara:strand:+ start:1532 stop:2254 length:723 start_codon:yes stop_codon:yes gene_type:complete